jgi:predicted MFS family arabinose efflux permease
MVHNSNLIETKPAHVSSPLVIAVAGLTALGVAMGIGRFAFTPILPMMQQDAAVSVGEGGWLASANYLGYLLGALSAVTLRVRATTAIRAGLVVIGLVTLGMGLAQSFAAWLVLRALAGVGSAWVLVFASAWALGKLSAAGRSVLRGTVFAGVGTGIAVAGVFCAALMQRSAGSAMAWRGLGVITLVGTMAIWRTLRTDHDGSVKPSRRQTGHSYRWDFDSVRLVLCYGTFGFGYIIPATFLPAMARELVTDPLVFGWAWPIFGIAAAISTLVAAAGTRFVGNRRLWALSHLVMALGVSAPVVWPTIGGIMIAAFLVGGTFMVNTMGGMQEAQIVGGPRATSLMAVMTAAFATGQVGGPLLVTYAVGPHGDFSRPLLISCLLLVVSAGALSRPRPAEYATPAKVVGAEPS